MTRSGFPLSERYISARNITRYASNWSTLTEPSCNPYQTVAGVSGSPLSWNAVAWRQNGYSFHGSQNCIRQKCLPSAPYGHRYFLGRRYSRGRLTRYAIRWVIGIGLTQQTVKYASRNPNPHPIAVSTRGSLRICIASSARMVKNITPDSGSTRRQSRPCTIR